MLFTYWKKVPNIIYQRFDNIISSFTHFLSHAYTRILLLQLLPLFKFVYQSFRTHDEFNLHHLN